MAEFGAEAVEPNVNQTCLTASEAGSINVVVIGATGVTGRYVVAELLLSPEVTSVRTVARSKYVLPAEYANSEVISGALKLGKLVEHTTDMEAVSDADLRSVFAGVHTFYNCFGSTRSKAGSKERFAQIDMNIPVRYAHIAKEMGVKHASLLTSDGASSTSFIHYLRIKGLIENAFRTICFPVLSIFRPGLLGRKEQTKFGEKLFSLLQTPIQTDDVARGMVEESLGVISGKSIASNQIYNNAAIRALNAERISKLQSVSVPSDPPVEKTKILEQNIAAIDDSSVAPDLPIPKLEQEPATDSSNKPDTATPSQSEASDASAPES